MICGDGIELGEIQRAFAAAEGVRRIDEAETLSAAPRV